MITSDAMFDIWAPETAIWSPWAKPVLFQQFADKQTVVEAAIRTTEVRKRYDDEFDIEIACPLPSAQSNTAVIVNLPGSKSVQAGMVLARSGFRPVPLYNAADHVAGVVGLRAIFASIVQHTQELTQLVLPADAPPAFLIDFDRCPPIAPKPGQFDNRWIVFPQDFPSGNFLLSHDIQHALLVQRKTTICAPDIEHVILRWQEAGINLLVTDTDRDQAPRRLPIVKPSLFRSMFYRARALLGFQKNSAGGFGSVIPLASSGG